MKVLIVLSGVMPVPAVKGGAVATLVENLIRENEKYRKMDLYIVSPYDKMAENNAIFYPNTTFIFTFSKFVKLIDDILGKLLAFFSESNHHYAWKLFTYYKIRKVLLENNFDKIVFQNIGYIARLTTDAKIKQKYEGDIYYHLHNDIPDEINPKWIRGDNVLGISNYLFKKIEKCCNYDFQGKFIRVQNGIDSSLFSSLMDLDERKKIREKFGIKENDYLIIFAGRIDEVKGIKELTEAVKKIDNYHIKLLVVGSFQFGLNATSKFESFMHKMFTEMGDRVIFTGFVPNSDIAMYYKISDLAVLPSIWEEPAGLTMIEASMAGVPLITTNSGGIPEYIDSRYSLILDRKNLVDDLAVAINKIYSNQAEWKENALKQKNIVCTKYTTELFYKRFVDALIKS